METYKNRKRGFTLIELLVVIAIIGVLSSVVLSSLTSSRGRARDAKRIQEIQQLKLALDLYADSNDQTYPSGGAGENETIDPAAQSGSSLVTPLTPYIRRIPQDPNGLPFHTYVYVSAGGATDRTSYGILVRLEKDGLYCRTGVNMDVNWWGSQMPQCPF
jgi:general secretion pathway protein G